LSRGWSSPALWSLPGGGWTPRKATPVASISGFLPRNGRVAILISIVSTGFSHKGSRDGLSRLVVPREKIRGRGGEEGVAAAFADTASNRPVRTDGHICKTPRKFAHEARTSIPHPSQPGPNPRSTPGGAISRVTIDTHQASTRHCGPNKPITHSPDEK